MTKKITLFAITATLMTLLASGCEDTTSNPAQKQALKKAKSQKFYIPHNDIELSNYNNRQKLADDPSTILWCTASFPNPSSELITVPIVGKLTSGKRTPFATRQVKKQDDSYNPDLPSADGFYGDSSDFRYGFSPAGVYSEFYNISTFCTTQPTVYQREKTSIVLETDPMLNAAANKAREALRQGNKRQATQELNQAIKATQ